MAKHLAHMMLIHTLRTHLSEIEGDGVGPLYALSDRYLGVAIAAVHGEPGRRWTVGTLAQIAGMSRSMFAERFRRVAGVSPMEYVVKWRMALASEMLLSGRNNVSTVSASLGYESESAFSVAFKRAMGSSPKRFQMEGGHPKDNRVLALDREMVSESSLAD